MDLKSRRIRKVHSMKRDLIMDAALKVITRDGYQGAKLEDIAREAGFSKASLYHYFPDREALVLKLIIREQNRIIDTCKEILLKNEPVTVVLKDFLNLFLEKIAEKVRFFRAFGDFSGSGLLQFADMAQKHKDLFSEVEAKKDEIQTMMIDFVRDSQNQGQIDSTLDPKTFSVYMLSMIHGILFENWQTEGEQVDLESEAEKLFKFLSPWVTDKNSIETGGVK
ncbi:TetR/AcrR family transcriptional regulator [Chitinispirillales bacterium ANBcel5]|uniref:TetR/AcrR family transcriptional regulator n=1 Tax=Cellulosispirillum alkaliphilum TaxID=3039283 RepID=UPI002A515ED9|nr:TetR/AcrR family transcriptional regulator [Chitinispirillales bacterium ANBcel5]